MKGLIATLLMALVAAAANDQCPSDWHEDRLLAHEDCDKFYMCTYGELVEKDCPPNLYFNLQTLQCDWIANVDCGDRNIPGQTTPEPTTTTPEPTTTTPEPTTTPTQSTSTTSPTTPPSSGFLENGCPVNPHIHWLLPVPGDCNGFYYCVWGELVRRACPATLHFNRHIQVCDWPANAGCV